MFSHLLIILTASGFTFATYNLLPTHLGSRALVAIFKQYRGFDFIIHYDRGIPECAENVFDMKFAKVAYSVNYDKQKDFLRPNGYRFINIVLLSNPLDFEFYGNVDYNLYHQDVVLFVIDKIDCTNSSDESIKIWEQPGVERAGTLFVFEFRTQDLHYSCYYCGNDTAKLKKIGSGDYIPDLNGFRNKHNNFNGHTFRIAYAHFPPFFYCSFQDGACTPLGAEGHILHAMGKMYNFKYELVTLNKIDGVGEWAALVQAVYHREVDWAVGGISATMDRATITDFTRYISIQGYTALYAVRNEPWVSFVNVTAIFHWSTLSCMIATILLISSFAIFADYTMKKQFTKYNRCLYLRLLIRSLSEQPCSRKGERALSLLSIKTIVCLWWLVALCLTTSSKSLLASSLITPRGNEPEVIGELLKRGYTFQVNKKDWSALKENFQKSSSVTYKEVLNKVNGDLDLCDSIRLSLDTKVAVIEEETPVQYEVYGRCNKMLTPKQKSSLRLIRQNIFPGGFHGWCMQMSTPFAKFFSHTLARMDASGLLSHWYAISFHFKIPRSNDKTLAMVEPLNIGNLFPAFVIVLIGLICSLLTFFGEIYYRQYFLERNAIY